MTHAWLFTGPPGSGRSVAARAFAAALQCEFGGCGGARRATRCSPAPTPTSARSCPDGLTISVKEIRGPGAATGRAAPSSGRWQIVLIEDADRLTEEASNALLKAIEEPRAAYGVPAVRAVHGGHW